MAGWCTLIGDVSPILSIAETIKRKVLLQGSAHLPNVLHSLGALDCIVVGIGLYINAIFFNGWKYDFGIPCDVVY